MFFWSKIAIYLSLGLHKGRPSYRRSLQPSKNIQHFDTCLMFLYFFHFYSPGSGFRIRIRTHWPDRILTESGSQNCHATYPFDETSCTKYVCTIFLSSMNNYFTLQASNSDMDSSHATVVADPDPCPYRFVYSFPIKIPTCIPPPPLPPTQSTSI